MADAVARNDPCPCGSGLKYKKCCMRKGGPERNRRWRNAAVIAAVTVVLAVGLAIAVSQAVGGVVGGLGVLVLGAYIVLSDPPPPGSKSGDPGAINFGR